MLNIGSKYHTRDNQRAEENKQLFVLYITGVLSTLPPTDAELDTHTEANTADLLPKVYTHTHTQVFTCCNDGVSACVMNDGEQTDT